MEYKTIQEFQGTINNVSFCDKDNFYATLFILEQINDKFNEIYNDKFIEDLSDTIDRMYMKYDDFSYATLENEFTHCIKEANTYEYVRAEVAKIGRLQDLEILQYDMDGDVREIVNEIKFKQDKER